MPEEGFAEAQERVLREKATSCGVNAASIDELSVKIMALLDVLLEVECRAMDKTRHASRAWRIHEGEGAWKRFPRWTAFHTVSKIACNTPIVCTP